MNWRIDSLDSLIDFLAGQGTVYAPMGDKTIRYKKIDKNTPVNLSRNSDFSAREVWQPVTHYYLKYQGTPESNLEVCPYHGQGLIVVGLRPCDMKGWGVFNRIFGESDMFQEFNKRTIIIGYLCESPGENCFCESMGIAPCSKEKMDLALYQVEGGYILSAETAKGNELFKASPFTLVEHPPAPTYRGVQKRKICIEDVVERIDALDEAGWEAVTFPCINCRICSYVCPTCHCFTITDEVFKNTGGRALVWDSCQCKYFTREASGATARSGKIERAKNRVFHKLKYYARQNGEMMCSGCGRCISNCPFSLDLFKEINEIKQVRND